MPPGDEQEAEDDPGRVPTSFRSRLPAPTLDSGTSDIARRLLPFRGGFPESWGTWGTKLPPQGGYRLLNFPATPSPIRLPGSLMRPEVGSKDGGGNRKGLMDGRVGVEPKAYPRGRSCAPVRTG